MREWPSSSVGGGAGQQYDKGLLYVAVGVLMGVPLGLVLGNLVLGLGIGIALAVAGGSVIGGSASRWVSGREERESPAAKDEDEPTGPPTDTTGSVPGL